MTNNTTSTHEETRAFVADLLDAWEDGAIDLIDAIIKALRADGVTHDCPTISILIYMLTERRH